MWFFFDLLEAYVGRFEEELSSAEAESAKVSDEIEGLIQTHEEGESSFFVGSLICK